MTRKTPPPTLGFDMALASVQTFIHDSHNHSPALTDVERQVSESISTGKSVQGCALSDWEDVWQPASPHPPNGDLDPVPEQKAREPGDKGVKEYRAYHKKGYATDVEQIGIENDVIELHVGETVNSCKHHYSGYKILHYASGKKGVRYLLERQQGDVSASKSVWFSDHIIDLRESQHFYIFMGNEPQKALLKETNNWSTYYPCVPHKEQIADEALHHQNR